MDNLERYRDIVPDYEAFKAIQSRPLPGSCRINTLKIERDALLGRLEEKGVLCRAFDWYSLGLKLDIESPGKMVENLLGYIHIQEELSMVPPLVLDPQPGETVLDLCASPGSKTTQISQMMNNRGLVIANEPSLDRVCTASCQLRAAGGAECGHHPLRWPDLSPRSLRPDLGGCALLERRPGKERSGHHLPQQPHKIAGAAKAADPLAAKCRPSGKAGRSGGLLHLHLRTGGKRAGGERRAR